MTDPQVFSAGWTSEEIRQSPPQDPDMEPDVQWIHTGTAWIPLTPSVFRLWTAARHQPVPLPALDQALAEDIREDGDAPEDVGQAAIDLRRLLLQAAGFVVWPPDPLHPLPNRFGLRLEVPGLGVVDFAQLEEALARLTPDAASFPPAGRRNTWTPS